MNLSFIENPSFTLVKIIAIAFVTVLYSMGGIFLTIASDKYVLNDFYDKTDEEADKKSTSRHLAETTAILAFFGVIAYIGRNVLQLIPFPLENVYGLKYANIKEVSSGSLLLWIIINYSPVLTRKINIIRNRFNKLI